MILPALTEAQPVVRSVEYLLGRMKQVTRGLPLLEKALDLTRPKRQGQTASDTVVQPG